MVIGISLCQQHFWVIRSKCRFIVDWLTFIRMGYIVIVIFQYWYIQIHWNPMNMSVLTALVLCVCLSIISNPKFMCWIFEDYLKSKRYSCNTFCLLMCQYHRTDTITQSSLRRSKITRVFIMAASGKKALTGSGDSSSSEDEDLEKFKEAVWNVDGPKNTGNLIYTFRGFDHVKPSYGYLSTTSTIKAVHWSTSFQMPDT